MGEGPKGSVIWWWMEVVTINGCIETRTYFSNDLWVCNPNLMKIQWFCVKDNNPMRLQFCSFRCIKGLESISLVAKILRKDLQMEWWDENSQNYKLNIWINMFELGWFPMFCYNNISINCVAKNFTKYYGYVPYNSAIFWLPGKYDQLSC